MARGKQSKEGDMDKLRRILDGPGKLSDDEINDELLHSLKQRVEGKKTTQSVRSPAYQSTRSRDLQPSVNIKKKNQEEKTPLQREEPCEEGNDPIPTNEQYDLSEFKSTDLYEIQRPDDAETLFMEVKPEIPVVEEKELPGEKQDEKLEEVPEWKTVEPEIKTIAPPVQPPMKEESKPPEELKKVIEKPKPIEETKEEIGQPKPVEEPKKVIEKPKIEIKKKFIPVPIKKPQEKAEKPVVKAEPIVEEKKTEETFEKKEWIEAFKGINSIDDEIGELLYKNGFTSVSALQDTCVNDLIKIRGIKRKKAKEIRHEINDLSQPFEIESKTLNQKKSEEWESKQAAHSIPIKVEEETKEEKPVPAVPESIPEPIESSPHDKFCHGEYGLYEKEIKTASGKVRSVRFFSKVVPDIGKPIDLPEGYEVKVNKRTGLPYLKHKEK